MSQIDREDWWTKPLDEFAKEVWEIGWDRSKDTRQVGVMTGILQARATLTAAASQRQLIHATWALVGATLVVAVATVVTLVLSG